jgi:polyisoprenoid-binding protein YceI
MTECLVYVYKDGLLSPVGHDLTLRVNRVAVEVAPDGATLEARFDPRSLTVAAPASLSASDRDTIERTIVDEVLEARRHPEIHLSARVQRDGDRALVRGTLHLHGRTRPLTVAVERAGGAWRARVPLRQRDFDIRPYTALLGGLRVRDEVLVELTLEEGEWGAGRAREP